MTPLPDAPNPPRTTGQRLARPFWNAGERRLRAGWRLLLQTLLLILFSLPLSLLTFSPWTGRADSEAILTLFMITGSVWVAGRLLDRRRFSDFGLRLTRRWWAQLAFGLLLGAALMSAIFLIEWLAGWLIIDGIWFSVNPAVPFYLAIVEPLILFVAVGFYEELWTRGYQLRNLAEGLRIGPLGSRAALIGGWLLSSLLFGALHAGNPNATLISTLNIALAGVFLGIGYVLTGELAIPIGLHISWNFFQGNVFGFPVSGTQTVGGSVLQIVQGGPPLWTGGQFGPEAGLLGIGAILLGSLLVWLYVRQTTGTAQLQSNLAVYQPSAPLTNRSRGLHPRSSTPP